MSIKHRFLSGIADSLDLNLVRPSNWNDDHYVDFEGLAKAEEGVLVKAIPNIDYLTPNGPATGLEGLTPALLGLGNVTNESKETMFASPVFTGAPTATTPPADTNTDQLATTSFVLGQSATSAPLSPQVTAEIGMSAKYAREDHRHPSNFTSQPSDIKVNGLQAVGTLDLYCRADHVHPTDDSRASTDSPIFTGTVNAPQFASTVPTGTQPITVLSNTMVANFNAQYIGGTALSGLALNVHAHGNITSAGAIGTSAGVPIITTAGGVLSAGAFGTTSGTFCQGNDIRLSDSRPASDVSAWAKSVTKPNYTYTEVGAAAAIHSHDASYAPISKGVTNGDSHDHNGGDGAQISYLNLTNIPASFTPSSHATSTHSDWPVSVSMTEVGYLDGVSSPIQTQIDSKLTNPLISTGDMIYRNSLGNTTRLPIGAPDQVLTVKNGIPTWAAAASGGTTTPTASEIKHGSLTNIVNLQLTAANYPNLFPPSMLLDDNSDNTAAKQRVTLLLACKAPFDSTVSAVSVTGLAGAFGVQITIPTGDLWTQVEPGKPKYTLMAFRLYNVSPKTIAENGLSVSFGGHTVDAVKAVVLHVPYWSGLNSCFLQGSDYGNIGSSFQPLNANPSYPKVRGVAFTLPMVDDVVPSHAFAYLNGIQQDTSISIADDATTATGVRFTGFKSDNWTSTNDFLTGTYTPLYMGLRKFIYTQYA